MQKYQVHKAHLNNVCHLDPQEGVYLASDVEGMTDRLLKVKNDRIAELEKALRFVLENELVYASPGRSWRDSGCGCCSGSVEVPVQIAGTLHSLMGT